MNQSFFKNDREETPAGEIPQLDDKSMEASGRPQADRNATLSDEGRLGAILSYIPFLCFIPLVSMKENREIRFHARQGVLLFLIELVAAVFLIDRVSDFVFTAVLIAAIALALVGIYYAVQGRSYRLPIIGDLADKSKL